MTAVTGRPRAIDTPAPGVCGMTLRIFEETNEHEEVIALHGWLTTAEVAGLEELAVEKGQPLRT